MAHCYSYTPKGGTVPEPLDEIDRKISELLNIPYHEKNWVENWGGTISTLVASGKSLPEVRELLVEWRNTEYDHPEDWPHMDNLIAICDFLDTNYTARAWRTSGFAH